MLKRMIVLTALVAAAATPALASQCPGDMAKIDTALESVSLPDNILADVIVLRKRGEAEHGAGNHAASVATLAEAMRLVVENT